jgi:hypothetical protein
MGAPVAHSGTDSSGTSSADPTAIGAPAGTASGIPGAHGQAPGTTPGLASGSVPEGYAGSDIPGAGAGTQKTFEEGTAEYAVQQLVLKMQAGNTEGMDKLISEKTKDDVLQPLVEGKADADLINKNKELVAGARLTNQRESGKSKLFYVNNTAGQVLTITARRDGDAYKVVSIRVETPRGAKARQ